MPSMMDRFDEAAKEYEKWRETRLRPIQRGSAIGRMEDVALQGPRGPVRLSRLFGDRADLLVIQNMGARCPYCTMWADGFSGLYPHILDRSAFVLVSPDPPAAQQKLRKARKWKFPLYSSRGTRFKKALGFELDDGRQVPGVSAFRKDADGAIRNVANDVFGPGDPYCSAWHFFDLLEGGPGKWQPRFGY